jgi:arylsulfatase A-like enzyme
VHWPFQRPRRPDMVRTRETWYDGTRADYIEMMQSVDSAVGQVLNTLDREGIAKNTFVIFTSDNGGERLSDTGPYFNTKGTLWEGGIHVPGLARWPAALPKGEVSAQVAITMDWTATILAAAGVQPERQLDGINLLPILQGKQTTQDRTLCWRIDRAGFRQQAIRSGKWKLVTQPTSVGLLLYDLEHDPGERRNLFYEHQDKVKELHGRLEAWGKEMNRHQPRFSVK